MPEAQNLIRPRKPEDPKNLYLGEKDGPYVLVQALGGISQLDAGTVYDHGSVSGLVQSCFDNAGNVDVEPKDYFQVEVKSEDMTPALKAELDQYEVQVKTV